MTAPATSSPPGQEPGAPTYDFELDPFQVQAIVSLDAGRSVLVAAPTGSGKTVVAEHAVALALAEGKRIFYTTPIKALSNQKYGDLARRYGAARVGLLTGDNAINGDAPIVVMTTEVLRNMIYAGSTALRELSWVVLDEVHYLQDAYRGPVWEEVIIHLPSRVRLVCLSATVSNAHELADWIGLVRGACDVVVETERPVRLENLFMAADRSSERLHLVPTLVDGRPNPEGRRFDTVAPRPRGRAGGRPRSRFATPRRVEVVEELAARDLVPALYFIFSRAACDDAMLACLNAGVRLTTPDERERVRAIAEEHTRGLSAGDLDVLGWGRWISGLEAGVAAHHAGMVPPFKETVEACFTEGLVKVVFATETLALGINMPARTVVIEKLSKYNGERHETLTPGEYTQLTGRAGRRGIDPVGHAVVLWSPFVSFEDVASLASSRSFFLRSAFRPTYNMAANLVRRYDQDEAIQLLNRSFAQYQADRSVVQTEQRLKERRNLLAHLREGMALPADQVAEWRELRRQASEASVASSAGRRAVESAIAGLVPGTVIRLERHGGGPAVVVSVAQRRSGEARLRALTPSRRLIQVQARDFEAEPARLGEIELPRPYIPTNRQFQEEVVRRLARARLGGGRTGPRRGRGASPPGPPGRDEPVADRPWQRAENHPLAGHPDLEGALRQLARVERVEREVSELTRRVDGVSDTVGRHFRRLLELLEAWGYVDGWRLTERGQLLARCYHECDLLVVESLVQALFDHLDPPTLAALASVFSYEHRSRTLPQQSWLPSARSRESYAQILELAHRLQADEQLSRLPMTREPDATFAGLAYAWASGSVLDDVLADEEVSGGDFVRNVKQLLDLCRQLAELAPDLHTADTAAEASDRLFRGVIAASSMVGATGADDDEPMAFAEDEGDDDGEMGDDGGDGDAGEGDGNGDGGDEDLGDGDAAVLLAGGGGPGGG